jgi:hypothetical protein
MSRNIPEIPIYHPKDFPVFLRDRTDVREGAPSKIGYFTGVLALLSAERQEVGQDATRVGTILVTVTLRAAQNVTPIH